MALGLTRKLFGLAALALAAAPPLAAASQSLEYPVKAAYLSKFAPFVEWPAGAFGQPDSPFVVCVVGDDPFGPAIDNVVAGQSIGQRPIVVRRLARLERTSPCHVAYVSGSRAQSVADSLAAARGSGVLTVTDSSRPGGARGIVHFVVKDNRVRFHIDDQAAAQNGIAISSKLLSLALSVKSRREPG
jgi:hypothetical protein